MSRTVNIAITDHGTCSGGSSVSSASTGAGGRTIRWHDPGEGGIPGIPDDPGEGGIPGIPDDPGEGGIPGIPDDPGEGGIVGYPDDPSGGSHGSHRHGGCGCGCQTAIPWTQSGCPTAGTASTPATTAAASGTQFSGWVIVRLTEEHAAADFESLDALARDRKLEGLLKALGLDAPAGGSGLEARRLPGSEDEEPTGHYLPSRPLIRKMRIRGAEDKGPIEVRQALRDLEGTLRGRWPTPGPSLLRYWRIDCRSRPERVAPLLAELRGLQPVDLAYRELLATDPADYDTGQSYLDAAPIGIGARGAWQTWPTNTTKIRLVDLEQRWVLDHVELKSQQLKPFFGDNRYPTDTDDGNHGTAVLGQLAALGQGIAGIASAAVSLDVVSHWSSADKSNGNVAEAIVHALLQGKLGASDLLLLEVQRSGGPTELEPPDRTAIQLATAAGVTVIEPAGNGNLDLDAQRDPEGHLALRRGASGFRESGAVMVGAAWSTLPHDRASFSSYGSRVDCYGWGDSVLTAGYGDFDSGGGPDTAYTDRFSGTSSASPCVAGAAALVQGLYCHRYGQPLGPRRLREVLADPATGTRQGPNVAGAIGVMPNLDALLGAGSAVAPRLYLRRSTADDGLVCRDVTFTCPDVFACKAAPASHANALPGGGLKENAVAPGVSPFPATVHLFASARNRGSHDAKDVEARFYTADIATFIGPERWKSAGPPPMSPPPPPVVPRGDLPVVVPISGQQLASAGDRFALLALLGTSAELIEDPMVRLRCCFDWDAYRSFLERPDVGCRNTHWAGATETLDFQVTGAPDRPRTFEFQVLQRLPEKVTVTLATTPFLTKLLARSQPWLATASTAQAPPLPSDPLLSFPDVRLPANAAEASSIQLSGATADVKRGHSVAIRQLYRGREVGRITWYFK